MNEIKIRKNWGSLNPVTRVHGNGKEGRKPKYGKKDRRDWKKGIQY